MFPFLLLPDNLPFLAAASFIGAAAMVEVALLAVGTSLGGIAGLETEPDAEAGGPLAWLGLGKVPLSVLLTVAAAGFAGCGFALQAMALASFGTPLSWPLASAGALAASLPLTGYATAAIVHLVPREESYGTKHADLLGRHGVVVQGTATADLPAEVRAEDAGGKPVYVLVVPAPGSAPIPEGTRVVLTGRQGLAFVAEPVAAPNSARPVAATLQNNGKLPR